MSAFTASVTARYMRLKQASPSLAGRAASIAAIRAIASAIEVTGPDGNGEAAAMATLYGCHPLLILFLGRPAAGLTWHDYRGFRVMHRQRDELWQAGRYQMHIFVGGADNRLQICWNWRQQWPAGGGLGRTGLVALEPLTGADPEQVAGYRVRARLGAGGMGRVYLAFTPGGRPVALKVVRPEYGDDADFRTRFRQEIQAARQVHGLYTAQVLDAGPDADPPWLVTAYVPGPSLAQAVREYGPMPPQTVFQLMAGVAEALQAIHSAGVVHRDLKPSNVLLAPDGPRVIDFGIARAVEATTVTRTGMRVGSAQYMAPEQIAGRSITPAIDVFALGSLATFAALGRPPFGEGGEAAVMYRILHEPPDLGSCEEPLRGVIERCLAKQPADRPEPAEIISACRVHTAGKTLEIAQSWLPAAVAAALGEHVAPPAPPPPGAAPADGAQPRGPDAPTAYPPGPDAPTAYPPPPAPGGGVAAG